MADAAFWCHECARRVQTQEDTASGELSCETCGGNFVEEIDAEDPPEEFTAAGADAVQAPPSQTPAPTNGTDEQAPAHSQDLFERFMTELQEDFGPASRASEPGTPPSAAAIDGESSTPDAQTNTTAGTRGPGRADAPSPLTELLQQLVTGGGGGGGMTTRTARIVRSNGTPVEFIVTSTGEGGDLGGGLLGLLNGVVGAPFGGLASNPGDYALGPHHLSQLINQLMQNDPNRHGAPPAAKDVVEKLPKHKVAQSEVDANAECAVCKDLFVLDDEAQDLPCSHSFHPDCIMPWLKMHNSCPVCRFELPTDDQDYEQRRHQQHDEHTHTTTAS